MRQVKPQPFQPHMRENEDVKEEEKEGKERLTYEEDWKGDGRRSRRR